MVTMTDAVKLRRVVLKGGLDAYELNVDGTSRGYVARQINKLWAAIPRDKQRRARWDMPKRKDAVAWLLGES